MSGTVVVVGDRTFEVTVHRPMPDSMQLSVIVDDREQWNFEIKFWRPWACGVSQGQFYLWSARKLIVFSDSMANAPSVIEFDEDLLLVFRPQAGWVLVCETSVRLLHESAEVSRVELDEVIEGARWELGRLSVRDLTGRERYISIAPGELLIETKD